MATHAQVLYTCDNCGADSMTTGRLPEGWSGSTFAVPGSDVFGIYNMTGHRCSDCIAAVQQATDAALRSRKPLATG